MVQLAGPAHVLGAVMSVAQLSRRSGAHIERRGVRGAAV